MSLGADSSSDLSQSSDSEIHDTFHKTCYSDPLEFESNKRGWDRAKTDLKNREKRARQVWCIRKEEAAWEREQARLNRRDCFITSTQPQFEDSSGEGKGWIGKEMKKDKSSKPQQQITNDQTSSLRKSPQKVPTDKSGGDVTPEHTVHDVSTKHSVQKVPSAQSTASSDITKSTDSRTTSQSSVKSTKLELSAKSGDESQSSISKKAIQKGKTPSTTSRSGPPMRKLATREISKCFEPVDIEGEETLVSVGVTIKAKAQKRNDARAGGLKRRKGVSKRDGPQSSTSSIFDRENRSLLYIASSVLLLTIAVPLYLVSHKSS